jgi:hypothetical protein
MRRSHDCRVVPEGHFDSLPLPQRSIPPSLLRLLFSWSFLGQTERGRPHLRLSTLHEFLFYNAQLSERSSAVNYTHDSHYSARWTSTNTTISRDRVSATSRDYTATPEFRRFSQRRQTAPFSCPHTRSMDFNTKLARLSPASSSCDQLSLYGAVDHQHSREASTTNELR